MSMEVRIFMSKFRQNCQELLYKVDDLYIPVKTIRQGNRQMDSTTEDLVIVLDTENKANVIVVKPYDFYYKEDHLSIISGDVDYPLVTEVYFKDQIESTNILHAGMKLSPATFGHSEEISLGDLRDLFKFSKFFYPMYLELGGVKIGLSNVTRKKVRGCNDLIFMQFNCVNGVNISINYWERARIVEDGYVVTVEGVDVFIKFGDATGSVVVPEDNDYAPLEFEKFYELCNEFVNIRNKARDDFRKLDKETRSSKLDIRELSAGYSSYFLVIGSVKLKLIDIVQEVSNKSNLKRFVFRIGDELTISLKLLINELAYWHTEDGTFIGNRRYLMGVLQCDTTLQIIKE